MNWPFVIRATLFGLLFFLYNVASGIVVLGEMPDAFGWLKIVASGVVAFVIGTFTFVRDPERAWNEGPAMKKVLALVVAFGVGVGLAGCMAPQASLPAGAACVAYGNARADYAAAKMLATQYCKSGTLPAEACETLKQVDIRAQVYREQVEKALMDPTQPVDWPKVLQYSEEVVGVLLKIAP